jgi:molecular chaperone GrpE (heat shock protein)
MTEGPVGKEETLDTSELRTEKVLDEREGTDENLEDIPCSETGAVEEELVCLDDALAAMEERLTEAESKAAEYLDGWQRTQASFANYRKRTEAEQAHSESVTVIELDTGDPFDPLYHQAVVYQEVEGFEDGQIVAEVEKGYLLGERVLRPSMVVVAKAPVRKETEEDKVQSPDSSDEVIEGKILSTEQEGTSPVTTDDEDTGE